MGAWSRSWDLRNCICFCKHLIHVQNLLLASTSLYLRTECVRMGSASPEVQAVWVWTPLLFHLYNYYSSLNWTYVYLTVWIQADGYKPVPWEDLSPSGCRILPANLGSLSAQNNMGWKATFGVCNKKVNLRKPSLLTCCPVMSHVQVTIAIQRSLFSCEKADFSFLEFSFSLHFFSSWLPSLFCE